MFSSRGTVRYEERGQWYLDVEKFGKHYSTCFERHSLIIRSSGNNYCSQVSYSIVLDSVFCLSLAVSV